MKKFLLSIAFICGIIWSGLAQENSILQGVWKLHKTKDQSGIEKEVPPIFYKFFQLDGKFSNLALRQDGLTTSHKGVFILDTKDNSYLEDVQDTEKSPSAPLEAKNKLKISFSEDKKSFTIQGLIDVNGGKYPLYETWSRLD